jgi:hypothetical protein
MRVLAVVLVLTINGLTSATGGIRGPSCDALVAIAVGARVDPVEVGFGKPVASMTLDDFEQAIDLVSVCLDIIASGPEDVPGLMLRERKRPQLAALTILLEDLKLYRSQERERRAAQRRD